MNTVHITTTGALTETDGAVIQDPLPFLGHRVLLAEDWTLRSFFRLVARYPVTERLSAFLPSQVAQYRSCAPSGCTGAGFDRLEFSKTVEMIGFPGKPRLEIYHTLAGISGRETSPLESSHLAGLLDLPLGLGRLRHVVFGDKVDLFEFETVFTLFEFIDGIAWELSFHGKPDRCELRR